MSERTRFVILLIAGISVASALLFAHQPDPFAAPGPVPASKSKTIDYYVDNSCPFNGDGTSQACANAEGKAGPFNSRANAQDGLTGVRPDTRLLFRAGQTFTGKYFLHASGTPGHPFTISSYGSGPKPIFDAGGELFAIGITDLSNIVIDGVAVTNGTRGIWIYRRTVQVKNVIIKNNTVYKNPQFGIAYYSEPGLSRADASGSELHNNDVSLSATAIYIMRVNNLKIHHNLCRDNVYPNGHEPYGIAVQGGSYNDIHDNRIYNNLVTGLAIYGASDNIDGHSDGNRVYRNVIAGTRFHEGGWARDIAWQAGPGDYVGSNNQIFNNILMSVDPRMEHIVIDDSSSGAVGNQLYGNTVYGGWTGATFTAGGAGWTVKNNIFANTSGSIVVAERNTGLSFSNNIYFKPNGGILVKYNGTHYSAQTIKGALDPYAITANPRFVGTSVWSDFRLQTTSPAISAGANLGGQFQDAFDPGDLTWPGSVGVQGGGAKGWNIGAFAH